MWGLVLRPFSTCSSLMSFSPFSRFLWLLSLLVASFLFSLECHRAPFSLFAGLSSTQLFPYWFCSHQFAELGAIHCLAFSPRACSFAFLSFVILFLAICRAFFFFNIFLYTDLFFSGLCLGPSLFSDSVDFSYSKDSLFKFFWGIFHGSSSTTLFFFLVLFFLALRINIGQLCFLRVHPINSCVGYT